MLVLSRKPEESIRIGEEVQIRVLRVTGSRVWIGIDAPCDQRILRGELPDGTQFGERTAYRAMSAGRTVPGQVHESLPVE